MKANFIILLIAEALCLAFLLTSSGRRSRYARRLLRAHTLRTLTEENRRRYEEARKQDQQNLKVQRVLCGVAVILITGLLWRTGVPIEESVRCGRGAPNPTAPADGSPPIRSETDPTSPAAGSRR